MLADILHGDFMQTRVPEGARRLNDIALSGNGEPTSARAFPQVVELIGQVMADFDLVGKIKLVLITNGSLVDRPRVQDGLGKMAALNGEVWFKFDSATASGMRSINQTRISPDKQFERLATAARLCPTWLQTCVFALDGKPPSDAEQAAYLAAVERIRQQQIPARGVLLCGTGNGMAVAANRHHGVRAALAWSPEIAHLAREHNDANVLVLPAGYLEEEDGVAILKEWLNTPFAGGRHARRVAKIEASESHD
jgi:RpiB/LacA/LacB family sugar-phosphate isomerase